MASVCKYLCRTISKNSMNKNLMGLKKINIVKKSTTVFCICCFLLFVNSIKAQDTIKKVIEPVSDYKILSDTNDLTQSDYLSALQKAFDVHNKVPILTSSFSNLKEIQSALADDDSAINLIKGRLTVINDRTINLQNLQTYNRLLTELQQNIQEYSDNLNKYDDQLDDLKKQLLKTRKDTLVNHIFNDVALRNSLMPKLLELREKRIVTDSLVKYYNTIIDQLKANVSDYSIVMNELLFKINSLTDKENLNIFSKERKYLWESNLIPSNKITSYRTAFQNKVAAENKIAGYYFKNTRNNRLLILIVGLVFFCWIFFNFKSLKKLNKLDEINSFNFKYISPFPFFAAVLLFLSLAPIFDLDAPAIYSELIQILTLITLSIFFIKKLSRSLIYIWFGYFLLFLLLPFLRLIGLPIYLERWWMFYINMAAIIFGLFVIIKTWKKCIGFKHLWLAGILYILLNLFALVCNLFGRVTMANIFHVTAAYSFAQAVALTILTHSVVEAFLLQIKSSRVRKKYPEYFEVAPILKGITKLVSVFGVLVWLVVLLDNLNVDDRIIDVIKEILGKARVIGSFSFTLGGIFLFLGIIWVANFLQKYISYFFGDIGDEILITNRSQRSSLMITRLVLLISGFLLAVAASGLPIDRITIILGALSVGIGLGLQNIVNNFVSGIILIFDRSLHIGDVVELGDKKGRVKEIGIRTSTLLTDDGAEIIIPNGDVVSHNVINWTLSNNNVRINLNFTITKPFELDKIYEICRKEIMSNENVLTGKEPEIFITAITATTSTIKLCFWCKTINRTEVTNSEIYSAIYNSLESNGLKLS